MMVGSSVFLLVEFILLEIALVDGRLSELVSRLGEVCSKICFEGVCFCVASFY